MQTDEIAIRELYDGWIRSTVEGDPELGLSLVADDAVFLVPGIGQMDGPSYVHAACGEAPDPDVDFELKSEVREIKVMGDLAWLWTEFTLVTLTKSTGKTSKVGGHSLSVLRRSGAGWVIVRDANTMSAMSD